MLHIIFIILIGFVVGLIAYFLGHSAGNAIQTFGLYGLVAAVVGIASALYLHRRHRRRSGGKSGRAAQSAVRPPLDPPAAPGD